MTLRLLQTGAYADPAEAPASPGWPRPLAGKHVAILGLGPSLETYMDLTRRLGGRRALADETWSINALGDVFACDRVFHMDDVLIQMVRAEALPESNIAKMLAWMRTHPGPIYTSRTHPDFPGLVEFPLEDVINDLGTAYFNNTASYAAALAIHLGASAISLWGCDYTYPNAHHAEKGRAGLEYWLGYALGRGIDVRVPESSSLMDSCEGRPLYGFGALGSRDAEIERQADGTAKVTFIERRCLPTAAEIEAAYDHSKHPSPLISGAAA